MWIKGISMTGLVEWKYFMVHYKGKMISVTDIELDNIKWFNFIMKKLPTKQRVKFGSLMTLIGILIEGEVEVDT